jgi:hypothetical protein
MTWAGLVAFLEAIPVFYKIWVSLKDKVQEDRRSAAIARAVEVYVQQKNVNTRDEAYEAAMALRRLRNRGK